MPRDTHRWIQREMHREKKTCLETYTEIKTSREADTDGERSTKSNIQHRDPQIEGDAETYIQRGTDIPRETEAETEKERHTGTHIHMHRQAVLCTEGHRKTHTHTDIKRGRNTQ